MIRLKCKRCKYEWDYKGKALFYCSCPRCLTKVRTRPLIKKKVEQTYNKEDVNESNSKNNY